MWWVTQGTVASLVLFFVPLIAFQEAGILSENGDTSDLWIISTTVGVAILIAGNLKVWIESRTLNIVVFVGFFGFSFCMYYLYLWGSNFLH